MWLFLPGARTPLIPVFEDNEGAISIASNPISNSDWNHIDVGHHSLRKLVEEKEIEVVHVPSAYQHADWFTKHSLRRGSEFHRDIVMILKRQLCFAWYFCFGFACCVED